MLFVDYLLEQYNSGLINNLYYHTSSLANSAQDNSYRYSGAIPNNYVCFGSDNEVCDKEHLYRIIGIFSSEIKLIKYDYTTSNITGSDAAYYGNVTNPFYDLSYYKGTLSADEMGAYEWHPDGSNNWNTSTLNTINLNQRFISYLGTKWSDMISNHVWYVDGYSDFNSTPKTYLNAESSGTSYTAKVGLMYISDYGYAADSAYWSTRLYSFGNAINDNWMYMGMNEWTISKANTYTYMTFEILDSGGLNMTYSYGVGYAIRPVFYLKSSVTYLSGDGSQDNPYRIGM